jgi:tRNA-dihydrouridine synthase
MHNFWQTLKKPIIALAPMEDVTDTVFREVLLSVSDIDALHVVFTEFTSTDGLCSERGRPNVIERLRVNASEIELLKARNTKLVAQIWGADPDKFRQSAKLIADMELFDGIDINMGCPVKKVVKHKSCAHLINDPVLAKEIILAAAGSTSLPVSVKTRIGFNQINTDEWIGHLLEASPKAITIHGRTCKMMSAGPALWDEIGKAVILRNQSGSTAIILGNGEVNSYTDALKRIQLYGVDGVMVGTGVFKNPWMFTTESTEINIHHRIRLMRRHILLYQNTWGSKKDYNVLKRFFKIYLNGFSGAAHWRDLLMRGHNYDEAISLLIEMEKIYAVPEIATPQLQSA